MDNKRKIEIQRSIIEIENPYPKDDLILTYADFLRERDYLGYYQFNPIVFNKIIDLLLDEWNSKKRMNRLSILQKTKQYFLLTQQDKSKGYYNRFFKPDYQLSIETKQKLFELFRKSFEESKNISEKQIGIVRKICNSLLINLELTPSEEAWLCANASKSEMILNRCLRYPKKSALISNWVKNNFNNDQFRNRRGEMISWIIDEEPDFEIDQQTLIDDFEYQYKFDFQAVKKYEDEKFANEILSQTFSDLLTPENSNDLFGYRMNDFNIDLPIPELKLFRRPYDITGNRTNDFHVKTSDVKALKKEFYNTLSVFHKQTMIWGIAFSRLDNKIKSSLLKKYYCNETYYSMFKVCKRTKNTELLKWILEQE